MATSSSTDFSITRNDILLGALRKTTILPGRATAMPADMQANAATLLNLMIKEWMADGFNLWAVGYLTVWTVASQRVYNISSSTTDHATRDYVKTEMRVAGATSDTTLELDSTTGITASDNIGILLDSGAMHWDTVASVTDSDTLELTTGLASAASVDKNVYAYTTKAERPMRILLARRKNPDGVDIPIDMLSRERYDDLANKISEGVVIEAYYDRQRDQGDLYMYLTPNDGKDRIELTVQRPLEDFDTATDNPDFPIEWGNALIYGLAVELAIDYGVSDTILSRVLGRANAAKDRVMEFDVDDTSITIQPDDEAL